MTRRRSSGGVILLAIAMVLITLMIGAALVMVCKVVFNQREATNSADAAALNVAKEAGYNPTVNVLAIGTPEFAGLGENRGNDISLLSYNNAVAKTIVVALSAEEEDTPEAMRSARYMKGQLDKLASALVNKIRSSDQLQQAFDQMAGANFLRVSQSSKIQRSGDFEWSYYGAGEASSIYFDPASMSEESFAKIDKFLKKDGPGSPHGQYYVKGYEPIVLAGVTIEALPVFPGEQPHLISNGDFQKNLSKAHSLPNSVRVKSEASSLLQRAAAVIGLAGNSSAGVYGRANRVTFPVEAPDSTIKFTNGPSCPVGAGQIVSDGENDLFNKELFSPSRVTQSTNGVFTTDGAQMDAWVAFNNGRGRDPRTMGFAIGKMHKGFGEDQRATVDDLLAIRGIDCQCTHTMYSKSLRGKCLDPVMLKTWATNFRRWSIEKPPPGEGVSALEAIKIECLESRADFSQRFHKPHFRGTDKNSGMKLFDDNKVYATPPYSPTFASLGSPLEYMEQILHRKTRRMAKAIPGHALFGGPTVEPAKAMQFILQDARKIKPFATDDEIRNALRSRTLGLGQTLWLKNEGDQLVLSDTAPLSRAEGRKFTLASWFNISGTILNACGDATYEDAPYSWTEANGQPFDPTVDLGVGNAPGAGTAQALENQASLGQENVAIRRGTPAARCLDEVEFHCVARPCELECPN